MDIKNLKRRLKRLITQRNYLLKDHKGNEQKFTYWAGHKLGYVKGKIYEIENILDEQLEFEEIVKNHSLKPNDGTYNATGLCGEVANVIKKIAIRNHLEPENVISMETMEDYKKMLNDELGDALFYLVRIGLDNDMNLQDIINNQVRKLQNQSNKYGNKF